jgi:uncharacterized protein (DUF885 family)/WD40 repeat protein
MSARFRIVTAILIVLTAMLSTCGQVEPADVPAPPAARSTPLEEAPLPATALAGQALDSPGPGAVTTVPGPPRELERAAISPATAARVENVQIFGDHNPRVAGLALLPDGAHLASVSSDLSLRIWDVATGQVVRGPIGAGERVYNVAFSPDGTLLATADAENTITLWDVESGQELRTLDAHGINLMTAAFSPDGTLLALGCDDSSIRLWSVGSGQELRVLSGHITPVTALAFSPDGTVLASGSARYSSVIRLWDLASGEELRTLVGHTENVHSLAYSPDGRFLASASEDHTVRLWKAGTGQEILVLERDGDPAYGLAFSPDSTLLAFSGDDGGIVLWDVEGGQAVRTLRGHGDYVYSLSFSPDGSMLASGGIDRAALLWGIPTEASLGEPLLPAPSPLATAPPSSPRTGAVNGLIAFSSYRDGESKIYTMDADGSRITPLSRTTLRETRPAWSPDGTRIAYVRRLGHSNHEIFVMNADGSGATQLTGSPLSVESEPTWSPDGSRIAFISNQSLNVYMLVGRFNVWVMGADGSDPKLLTELGGTNTSPDWSPDGSRIVFDSTRDENHEIYVINADGSGPRNLTEHPAGDFNPTWSPDGRRIAFVSDRDGEQEIYVMNADGSGQTRLTSSVGMNLGPAWSPDGQYITFYARPEPLNSELYRMRADGSELVRLTHHPNFDGFPSWQPSLPAVATLATVPAAAAGRLATGALLDQPSVSDVVASLEGLPLGEFFEKSFTQLMLRDPEWVTTEGLAGPLGTGNDRLTDISDAYVRETQQMQAAILDMLRQYDRDALDAEQRVSYDVYEWYLDDLVRQQEFMYYDYPATFFPVTAVHEQLIYFFTDIHPIANERDAQDYVARLAQVGTKFEQLLDGLQRREAAGIIPPAFAVQWALYGVRNLADASATRTPFYESFEQKLGALTGVGDAEKRELLQAAEEAIGSVVLPAYGALAGYLQRQQSIAPRDEGLWQFPNGDGYYAYLLRHYTTTGMTAGEIHALGMAELERIHAEMRAIFDELGYPLDESLPDLFDRVARDGGEVPGQEVLARYDSLIQAASRNLDAVFDLHPRASVVVVASPIRGMYVSGSLDGSRPGAFHAGPGNASEALYAMPTLAYHEAVPGHHFQIALAQESDLPTFRNSVSFLGYTEGWALYAERLAWELGWYEGDPYGNLGRLQAEAFRAARLVIDTGIHAKRWTFDQAVDYLIQNVGYESGDSVDPEGQIARYVVWPGQATAYMVGQIQIMALRQRAMDRLGDRFDLTEFHRVLLSNGSMPLDVLEQVVDGYIEARLDP